MEIAQNTEKKKNLTYIAEKILRAHEKGRFEAFIVHGEQRVGKSAYAIKSARDVYRELYKYDEDRAWRAALDCIKFEKKDVFRTIRHYMRSNEILPVLIWDDTGVHGSSYQFFLDSKEVAALKGVFDTVGTGLSGLIMTTPTPGSILKFIRDYHFPEIEISRMDGEWDRKAQPREYYHSKRGWDTRRTREYDLFSCYLPVAVWREYIVRRKDVALKAIDAILNVIDNQTEGANGEATKIKQAAELKEMKMRLVNTDSVLPRWEPT